jgi:leader peptidase (prepilin peptidase)/N-methyltransferase
MGNAQHYVFIVFLFALGSCVGSFLNVVIWRMPRGESLSYPPSHCPKCNQRLKWYDNLPVIGWLKLRGRCRFCKEPISARYPIIEAVTGLIFVFYYVMFYVLGFVPPAPADPTPLLGTPIAWRTTPMNFVQTWPIYLLYMFLVSGLLAASAVDFEQYIVPVEITWITAVVGIVVHTIVDQPAMPGALNVNPSVAALAAGGGVGLLISIALWYYEIIPTSFPLGDPLLDIDDRAAVQKEIDEARAKGEEVMDLPPEYSSADIRVEMRKEMMFLMPPMLLAAAMWALVTFVGPAGTIATNLAGYHWLTGLLGAIFGALIGGLVVWLARILGTFGFGRVAMGLGDVHLMFGVGAILGAGATTVAFFVAPFFGIILTIYLLVTGKRRELAFVPYLSMGTAFVLVASRPILQWLTPGMIGLRQLIAQKLGF